MLRVFFSKTLNMLNPEKVVPEISRLLRYRQRPRQAQQYCGQQRQRPPAQQFREAALPHHPRHNRQHRNRERQEAFGHKPHGAGRTQQQIAGEALPECACLNRVPEAAHRSRQPQQQNRVQHRISADSVNQQRGQKNGAGQQGDVAAGKHPASQPENQQAAA